MRTPAHSRVYKRSKKDERRSTRANPEDGSLLLLTKALIISSLNVTASQCWAADAYIGIQNHLRFFTFSIYQVVEYRTIDWSKLFACSVRPQSKIVSKIETVEDLKKAVVTGDKLETAIDMFQSFWTFFRITLIPIMHDSISHWTQHGTD